MAVTGVHAILYSSEADALRETLRDVFGWDHVDAGGGWLIFQLPPGELGVHPAGGPSHELTLMCDDLPGTMAELGAKGIEFKGEPTDAGWGTTVMMLLPGIEVMLYEPRHPTTS
jgi:hypothetical protein